VAAANSQELVRLLLVELLSVPFERVVPHDWEHCVSDALRDREQRLVVDLLNGHLRRVDATVPVALPAGVPGSLLAKAARACSDPRAVNHRSRGVEQKELGLAWHYPSLDLLLVSARIPE